MSLNRISAVYQMVFALLLVMGCQPASLWANQTTDPAGGTIAGSPQSELSSLGSAQYAIIHYYRSDGDFGDHTTGDYNDYWGLHLWGDGIDASEVTDWTSPRPFLGEDEYGRFAWIKLSPDGGSIGFIVHRGDVKDGTDSDRGFHSDTPEIWIKQDDGNDFHSQALAQGFATIRYHRTDGDYGDYTSPDYNNFWGLQLWGEAIDPTEVTGWTEPKKADGIDDYGAFWNVQLQDPSLQLSFIIHRGDVKDPGPDESFTPNEIPTAWKQSGDVEIYRQRGTAEGFARLHYHRPASDYGDSSSPDFNDFWGLHVWTGAASPSDWSDPVRPSAFDTFGPVFEVPLVAGAAELGYILHKGDDLDPGADQFLNLLFTGYEAWQLQGADPADPYILPVPACPVGGITLSSQDEVDVFPVECDEVTGMLTISGADITDLSPLSGLTKLGDRLEIKSNTILPTLVGLSSITSTNGYISIENNPSLLNLDGFPAMTSLAGGLSISNNDALSNLNGLAALTEITGPLNISNNDSLLNVDGLSGLTSITSGRLYIGENLTLANLDGLSSLISVKNDVEVVRNSSLSFCKSLTSLLDQVDDGAPGPGPGVAGIPDVGEDVLIGENLEGCNTVEQILEPAEVRVNVTKMFSDDSYDEVTVTLDCNDGFISQGGSALVAGGDPAGHTFIITDFEDGALDCTVTEGGGPAGYTSTPVDGCVFEDMLSSQVIYSCRFYNSANDAEYTVTKDWTVTNEGGNVVKEEAWVTIECNASIDLKPGLTAPIPPPPYTKSAWLGDGDTLTANVSTHSGKAACKAYEDTAQSGVETENGCAKWEMLSPGQKYGCSIYNTIFFEGIPTLSKRGMAILALLMLGVGLVGFRRFA